MISVTSGISDLSELAALIQAATETGHELVSRRRVGSDRRREVYDEFQAAASQTIVQGQYLRTLIDIAGTNQLSTAAVIALRAGESWLSRQVGWPSGMAAVIASASDHGFTTEAVRLDHAHTDLRETFRHLQTLIVAARALRYVGHEAPEAAGSEVVRRISAMYGELGEIGPIYARVPGLDARWKAQRAAFQRAAEECWTSLDDFGSSVEHDADRAWPWHKRTGRAARRPTESEGSRQG